MLLEKIAIPLVFLFICIFISRYIAEKALRKLTDQEKIALLDRFAGARMYMGIPLYILLFAFMGVMYYMPERNMLWLGLFVGLFSVYQVGVTAWSVQRMKRIEISVQYIRAVVLARTVMLFGFFGMFGLLFMISKR